MKSNSCPICDFSNALGAFFCGQCGAELTRQAGTSPAKVSAFESPVIPAGTESRICPGCGVRQDSRLPLCTACGGEMASTKSLPSAPGANAGQRSRAGEFLILRWNGMEISCHSGDVLGREGTVALEQFEKIGTISRRHVRFDFAAGRWQVTVFESVRNTTQLDGVEMLRGREYPLTATHKLRLSRQCEVEVEVPRPFDASS
jgi:hypothetical protein